MNYDNFDSLPFAFCSSHNHCQLAPLILAGCYGWPVNCDTHSWWRFIAQPEFLLSEARQNLTPKTKCNSLYHLQRSVYAIAKWNRRKMGQVWIRLLNCNCLLCFEQCSLIQTHLFQPLVCVWWNDSCVCPQGAHWDCILFPEAGISPINPQPIGMAYILLLVSSKTSENYCSLGSDLGGTLWCSS